jgi:outer membrane immunogenic protein
MLMPMLALRMKRAGLAIAAILVLVSLAPAQDDEGHFDVGLGYTGVFSKTSSASLGNTTLKPTSSGGVLASFRYRFNHTHGIAVNFGHTNNSQIFTVPPDTLRVGTGITEFSGAYVFSPFHDKRIDPFFLAGAGMLRFNPGNQYIDGFQSSFGAQQQTSLTFLYGGGADYRLWKALALRVQYRGLVYKVPDFKVPALFLGAYGHMAEPSVGIVFKF